MTINGVCTALVATTVRNPTTDQSRNPLLSETRPLSQIKVNNECDGCLAAHSPHTRPPPLPRLPPRFPPRHLPSSRVLALMVASIALVIRMCCRPGNPLRLSRHLPFRSTHPSCRSLSRADTGRQGHRDRWGGWVRAVRRLRGPARWVPVAPAVRPELRRKVLRSPGTLTSDLRPDFVPRPPAAVALRVYIVFFRLDRKPCRTLTLQRARTTRGRYTPGSCENGRGGR